MCWAIDATLGKFRGMEIEASTDGVSNVEPLVSFFG
jgi:hypothetical protein